MALSRQISVLAITLVLLLAPAAAARRRPSKGQLIAEVKKARDALKNPKLNGRYRASSVLLDRLIPQLETNWNPTDAFLASADGKTVLLPEDSAIKSAAPNAIYNMVKPDLKRQELRSYASWIRSNILDGVLPEEKDIATAKVLRDDNGRKVDTAVTVTPNGLGGWIKKIRIGKGKAKIKHPKLFKGRFFVIHGVDGVQMPQ
ncbi:unnamed protein product [Closterium sp. NIES-64]|nr:unnamed protein product [Closterium sp. NIES-64]